MPPHRRPDFLKLSPLTLVLIGALVGALAWGTCSNSRASDATKALDAALRAQNDSATAWQNERSDLSRELSDLKADSGRLATSYARAQALARLGRDSVAKLLALLPDSQRTPIGAVITTLTAEGESCGALEMNCEARAQNAEQRAHGDSSQLAKLQVFVHDTLEVAWHQAERASQPSFFRDLWRSRQVTIPLIVVTILSLVTHH